MNIDRYNLKAEDTLTVFEFVSDGPKGQKEKIVILRYEYQRDQ
jgi:hypothetical protein